MAYQTIIRKARFEVPGYTPEAMQQMGESWVATAIRPRIQSGRDVSDSPAPALSQAYARRKARRGLAAIRDWTFTGETMRAMDVISATHNSCLIGFTTLRANLRARANNFKWRQFGVSVTDRAKLTEIRSGMASPVQVKTTGA